MDLQEKTLAGKKIAILVANGFEEAEMTVLHKALVAAGAETKTVSPEKGIVNSWHGSGWGHFFPVNAFLNEAMSHHFDAVVIPGGARHVTRLSGNPQSARFLKGFMDDAKPVGLLNDGAEVLAEAGLVAGRKITAAEAAREKLAQKGAVVEEADLLVDANLISATATDGEDMVEAFAAAFIDAVAAYEEDLGAAA